MSIYSTNYHLVLLLLRHVRRRHVAVAPVRGDAFHPVAVQLDERDLVAGLHLQLRRRVAAGHCRRDRRRHAPVDDRAARVGRV